MNVFVSELMWFLMGDKDSIFSESGIGYAVMNRLLKAAGYHIIQV